MDRSYIFGLNEIIYAVKGDKKVYLLGETHMPFKSDLCVEQKLETIPIGILLLNIIELNKQKKIDLFVEYGFNKTMENYNPIFNVKKYKDYSKNVAKQTINQIELVRSIFRNCLRLHKECSFDNLRAHSVDTRVDGLFMGYNKDMDMLIKRHTRILDRRHSGDEIKSIIEPLLKYYSNTEIIDLCLIMPKIQEYIKMVPDNVLEQIFSILLYIYAEQDPDERISLLVFHMDVYTMLRLFKNSDFKNNVIYGGSMHIMAYKAVLVGLGFKIYQVNGGNNRCIDTQKLKFDFEEKDLEMVELDPLDALLEHGKDAARHWGGRHWGKKTRASINDEADVLLEKYKYIWSKPIISLDIGQTKEEAIVDKLIDNIKKG